MSVISKLFDWKNNPESIWIVAAPVAVMAFLCIFAVAFLQWQENGDYWYAIITLAGISLLVFAGYPLIKRINSLKNQQTFFK